MVYFSSLCITSFLKHFYACYVLLLNRQRCDNTQMNWPIVDDTEWFMEREDDTAWALGNWEVFT